MPRLATAALLFLVMGCSAPRAPAPAVRPGRSLPATPAGDAGASSHLAEGSCVPPRTRAEVDDCSQSSPISRAEVVDAMRTSDAEFAARVGPGAPGSMSSKEEERRQLAPRRPLRGQLRAFDALSSYVCLHGDDVEFVYNLARLHFELNHFAEAAVLFERVAEGSVEDELAPAAHLRWLETMNVSASVFEVVSCFDEMSAKAPRQRDRLCGADMVKRHPERSATCTKIGRYNSELERLRRR